jgi:predicted ArsR family transcriptional regulator
VENTAATIADARPGYGPLPSGRVRHRREHLSAARAGILDVLIDQPEPCTVGALSALTRQHPNTIREHLDGLVADGLARRSRALAQGRGRPPWLYSVTPDAGSDQEARDYAGLASALAAQIVRTSGQPRADAIEAGRLWGRDLVRRPAVVDADATEKESPLPKRTEGRNPVPKRTEGRNPVPNSVGARADVARRREVVTLLEELGFAPNPDARAGVIKLRRCPLLEAAHRYPDVVCGVHLGIVRGALDELGSDPDRTERTALQPFSEPGACRLDLLPRASTTG